MVARVLPGSVDDFPVSSDASESFIPSARLEQDEHKFGFRERGLPLSAIGSPQQMQTRGLIVRLAQQNGGAAEDSGHFSSE
jgi:hypothetical protein